MWLECTRKFSVGNQPKPETGKTDQSTDLDRLAYAVAVAETGNCTQGYGASYNNCFGIKNGNTAPCERVGRSNMCIYEKPEDSYEAFKKIWGKWYVNVPPTRENAARWTGNDNPTTWLRNVKSNL